jgi:hypothetical protein
MADRELEREQEEESGVELRVFIGPHVERHQQPVGHDARSRRFQNLKEQILPRKYNQNSNFPILYLPIWLSIDFGARDKTVDLRKVNNIALRIQS